MTKRKQRPRKSLDQKAAELFLQTGVAPESPEVQQDIQQELQQAPQQAPQQQLQQSNLLDEILKPQQETIRFTVDLPKDLHQQLCEASSRSGIPKTEIVRRLLNKALNS